MCRYVLKHAKEDTSGELEDTNIMLLTNFGTIEGEIVLDNNNFFSDCNELRNTLLANAPQKDGIIINNSSSIILKNAKIIPYANPSYSIQFKTSAFFPIKSSALHMVKKK